MAAVPLEKYLVVISFFRRTRLWAVAVPLLQLRWDTIGPGAHPVKRTRHPVLLRTDILSCEQPCVQNPLAGGHRPQPSRQWHRAALKQPAGRFSSKGWIPNSVPQLWPGLWTALLWLLRRGWRPHPERHAAARVAYAPNRKNKAAITSTKSQYAGGV